MSQQALAKKFHALFAGGEKAHGVYEPARNATKDGRGKLKGNQWADNTPPTVELWARHLNGDLGLGVYMLRDDGTVRFAAIDVDVYPLPHKLIVRRIKDAELPLVLCKSKSGGAHLYLFGKEDLPAALVRRRLRLWADKLNLYEFVKTPKDKIEIFPKADALSGKNDLGNYLNMPYFGGDRVSVNADGKDISAETFAKIKGVTVDELEALGASSGNMFEDGPPCLQSIEAAGPVDSYRDSFLLATGIYVKQRFPDDWESKLEEYHRQLVGTPLSAREVIKVQRNVAKHEYNYACQQEPLVTRCNKEVCITRKYGVRAVAGAQGQDTGFNLNLGQLKKFDVDGSPIYEIEIDGKILGGMTPDVIMNYNSFRRVCFEQLNVLPVRLTNDTWDEILKDKLAHMVIEKAPPDAGAAGQVRHTLNQFCLYLPAKKKEDLKDGRAWTHDGVIWFRLTHFEEYLKNHKIFASPKDITTMFRRWGFKHGAVKIKGSFINYWEMPTPDHQTEPDDVPRPGKNDAM